MKKLLVMCAVAALLSAPVAWGIDLEKKDYLKLIAGNTGKKTFVITKALIQTPDKELSRMVVKSFEK